MNSRTLIALWKANYPHWVWIVIPLWIGLIIIGLDGRAPQWGSLALSLVTVTCIMAIAEFANTYADRDEDWLYIPTNPLVTGELNAGTAKNAFILQNIIAGVLLVALLLVTLNYSLIIAMIVGWFVGLAYSVPPFRFKETVLGPFFCALGLALLPIAAWLSVAPLNDFIIAFAGFWFVYNLGLGVTIKLRKTNEALNADQIRVEEGDSLNKIHTVDLKLKFETAKAIEAIATLGAFILVPIFWYLGIFGMPLSLGLLTAPLALTVVAIILRTKAPVNNGLKCVVCYTMAWIFIMLSLLAAAITTLTQWGFAILACIFVLIVALALFRTIKSFGLKAVATPWKEL